MRETPFEFFLKIKKKSEKEEAFSSAVQWNASSTISFVLKITSLRTSGRKQKNPQLKSRKMEEGFSIDSLASDSVGSMWALAC